MKLNTKDYEVKMDKAIAAYEQNLATVRAGQANPNVLSRVSFDYYGAPTPLSSMPRFFSKKRLLRFAAVY